MARSQEELIRNNKSYQEFVDEQNGDGVERYYDCPENRRILTNAMLVLEKEQALAWTDLWNVRLWASIHSKCLRTLVAAPVEEVPAPIRKSEFHNTTGHTTQADREAEIERKSREAKVVLNSIKETQERVNRRAANSPKSQFSDSPVADAIRALGDPAKLNRATALKWMNETLNDTIYQVRARREDLRQAIDDALAGRNEGVTV